MVDLRAGSYSCRPQNNRRGAKLSEHSFGNALDIMAFHLADGREVTVLKGWRGNPREQDFLREVFVGACRYFATVLGPGADAFHYDHFHIDLARHDPRGERTICKPILKFMPRLDRAPTAGERPPATAAAEIPLDIEEDAPGRGSPHGGRRGRPRRLLPTCRRRELAAVRARYPPAPVQPRPCRPCARPPRTPRRRRRPCLRPVPGALPRTALQPATCGADPSYLTDTGSIEPLGGALT